MKNGEGVDKILARSERLPDPFERIFDDGHDLVPIVRHVDAEDYLHNRSRERAATVRSVSM